MKKILLASMMIIQPIAATCADSAPPQKIMMAKICATCHKNQENSFRGYFDNVSLKAKKIQLKMDDIIEILNFDPKNFSITNGEKTENLEYLQEIPKSKEVKIEYQEKDGKKYATKLVIKQPIQIPDEMLITTDEVARLVAMGPEKGKYHLYDSRPPIRAQEGMIPTAVNLPFPMFEQNVDKLPHEKDALVIFYCAGITCAMSPSSAKKAKELGYTNIKIYHEGMPEWSKKHYTMITAKNYKEAWLDKGIPSVLIDLRATSEAEQGYIKGAVTIKSEDLAKAITTFPPKKSKAPIIVYGMDTEEASQAAGVILAGGYGNVKVLQGGMKAWNDAGYPVEKGKLDTKITYVQKPKPGEIVIDDFKKIVDDGLKDTLLIDVRPSNESSRAMIKGAKSIPVGDLEKHLANLPKDKEIVAYCNTGTLAEMAYYMLIGNGYTKVKFFNNPLTIKPNGTYEISAK
ncbi:Sulfurtransferase [Gammaproteobacteria bacterium]